MSKLAQFIDELQARGKCTFTLDEAQQALGKSRAAAVQAIERMRHQGKIANPAKGFYVIVFPEYRRYGCLPAAYFVPYLMEFWDESYYACLATAASYHGASHQQPQAFQVMLKRSKSPIICGDIKIYFFKKINLEQTQTQAFSTKQSKLIISTPEATAIDLVNYINQSGGLNRVATILDELQEAISKEELLKLLKSDSKNYWKQRLGYFFEKLGAYELAEIIYDNLGQKGMRYILLDPSFQPEKREGYDKDRRWKIIENSTLESDL